MATLILYHKGVPMVKFLLDQAQISLGRSIQNDICIDDVYASKAHAIINVDAPRSLLDPAVECILEDLDSTNGSFVNECRVSRVQLCDDDMLRIGRHIFKYVSLSPECAMPGADRPAYADPELPTLNEVLHSGAQQMARFSRRLHRV